MANEVSRYLTIKRQKFALSQKHLYLNIIDTIDRLHSQASPQLPCAMILNKVEENCERETSSYSKTDRQQMSRKLKLSKELRESSEADDNLLFCNKLTPLQAQFTTLLGGIGKYPKT